MVVRIGRKHVATNVIGILLNFMLYSHHVGFIAVNKDLKGKAVP